MQIQGLSQVSTDDWPVATPVETETRNIDTARMVFRYALIVCRVVIVLRWPLGFVVAPMFVLGPLGAVAGAGVGVGCWFKVPPIRARLAVAPIRARSILFTTVIWPWLCSTQMLLERSNRHYRIMKLIRVEFGPGLWWRPEWIAVTFKPMAKTPESQWSGYESRVRAFFNFKGSTWQVDRANPNYITVTVTRTDLPEVWALGPDVPVEQITPPHHSTDLEPGAYSGDRLSVGIGADGDPIVWCPDEPGRGSLFVTGRTGGGKGYIVKLILVYGIMAGWRIRVANPKGSGEFGWCERFVDHASRESIAAMYDMIHDFRVEMDRRASVCLRHKVEGWGDLTPEVRVAEGMTHRDLLVIDELVALMLTKGTVVVKPQGSGRAQDRYGEMVGDVNAIVTMGRSSGCSVIAMTQHPISETMGPLGSTLKAQLGAKIAVGHIEPEAAGGLFGKSEGEKVATILRGGTPGRAVVQGLAKADKGAWRVAQMTYATKDQLRALVAEVEVRHPVTNYDPTHLEPVDDPPEDETGSAA